MKSGVEDPAVRLPDANIVASHSFDDGFVNVPNVPVFAEHETTAKDGRRLQFGINELRAVAERCNRRIRETNDYAAITIGHTPDPAEVQAGNAKMPEVIGFAGPFRLGKMKDKHGRMRYAILSDFHVFEEDHSKLKKNPRRSPEVWLEDDYAEMFLDPIALLGSIPPRLDMGLLYSADHSGPGGRRRIIEKYAAVAPSAANVFIPNDKYQSPTPGGSSAMIGPEEVQQIVEALEQTDWVQWVKSQMQGEQGANATSPEMTPPAPETGPELGEATGEMPEAPPGMAPEAPPGMAPESPPPAEPNGAGPPPGPPGEPEKEEMWKYAADASIEDDNAERPTTDATIDPDSPAPGSNGAVDMEEDAAAAKYSRAGGRSASRRELSQLRAQLQTEVSKRIDAERYSVLFEERQGKAFDLDEEMERCQYSKMPRDEQFTDHLKAMANYRPIPTNVNVTTFDDAVTQNPHRPGNRAGNKERYSQDVRNRAFRHCESKAIAGEDVDYQEVIERMSSGQL